MCALGGALLSMAVTAPMCRMMARGGAAPSGCGKSVYATTSTALRTCGVRRVAPSVGGGGKDGGEAGGGGVGEEEAAPRRRHEEERR